MSHKDYKRLQIIHLYRQTTHSRESRPQTLPVYRCKACQSTCRRQARFTSSCTSAPCYRVCWSTGGPSCASLGIACVLLRLDQRRRWPCSLATSLHSRCEWTQWCACKVQGVGRIARTPVARELCGTLPSSMYHNRQVRTVLP